MARCGKHDTSVTNPPRLASILQRIVRRHHRPIVPRGPDLDAHKARLHRSREHYNHSHPGKSHRGDPVRLIPPLQTLRGVDATLAAPCQLIAGLSVQGVTERIDNPPPQPRWTKSARPSPVRASPANAAWRANATRPARRSRARRPPC